MPDRVIPEPPHPLTRGPRATWAVSLPVALIEELKAKAKLDDFKSASAFAETLLIYALRHREIERAKDAEKLAQR